MAQENPEVRALVICCCCCCCCWRRWWWWWRWCVWHIVIYYRSTGTKNQGFRRFNEPGSRAPQGPECVQKASKSLPQIPLGSLQHSRPHSW